ncbi:unnamed protein product [Trichobilharzia szidati]|nr:unnamed protein product [Trichobilharzia szidati]
MSPLFVKVSSLIFVALSLIRRILENTRLKLLGSCTSDFQLNQIPLNPDKYVTNLSSVELLLHEKEVLSIGFNFSIPLNNISDLTIDSQFENLYDQLSSLTTSSTDDRSWSKVKCVDVAHQFRNSSRKQRSILTSTHFKSLKELRNRSDLVILTPDNGSGVVVMDRSDYKTKMFSILNDKSKFIADVPSDDIRELVGKVTSRLVELRGMVVIDKQEFNSLKPMVSDYPNLCGLPKIHKVDNPLRPILLMCHSPTHKLAKWLADILSPVRNEL